jgi:hypothetical protein
VRLINSESAMTRSTRLPLLSFLVFASALLPLALPPALAQAPSPVIVSTVPANLATGVSPTAPVVITFSTAMDTTATTAMFVNIASPLSPLPTTPAWSADSKTLTCTPTQPFPASTMVIWSVEGQDLAGDSLGGQPEGYFTTGTSGGGGTGSGTNRITSFVVGHVFYYDQTSTAAPTLDPNISYAFTADTTLASNRTATAVTLLLPTSALKTLAQSPTRPETYYLVDGSTNLATFQATYPSGSHSFNVQAATSNQQVSVNLPASLLQPGAPHVNNFMAAQAVDATQAFTLSWDAFPGGTTADYIAVTVGDVFTTVNPPATNALNGTATSVVIPAGTLPTANNYDATVTFYRFIANTNATYATEAFRATATQFALSTTSGATVPLVLTNATWASGLFSFDVTSAAGQTLTVEYSTSLQAGSWNTLVTTNSATGDVKITDPAPVTNPCRFYRARTGS